MPEKGPKFGHSSLVLTLGRICATLFLYLLVIAVAGIKIIGGITGSDGRYCGIFVKRILSGGQAALDGRL